MPLSTYLIATHRTTKSIFLARSAPRGWSVSASHFAWISMMVRRSKPGENYRLKWYHFDSFPWSFSESSLILHQWLLRTRLSASKRNLIQACGAGQVIDCILTSLFQYGLSICRSKCAFTGSHYDCWLIGHQDSLDSGSSYRRYQMVERASYSPCLSSMCSSTWSAAGIALVTQRSFSTNLTIPFLSPWLWTCSSSHLHG